MARKQTADSSDVVLQLNPEEILADDNVRSSIRPGDVARMCDSIIDRGGVQEPISVERLDAPSNGHKYRLLKGFIRHAAVSSLNKEKSAGLTLPALVKPTSEPVERLKTQITENVVRASLSPLDIAYSIKKLLDAGVARLAIRELFARPSNGKGGSVGPVSNAWLNVHLAMLDLPKKVQALVHNGDVTPWAAYELGRVSPDRREAVLDRAIKEVAEFAAKEEKDENKLLELEKRELAEALKVEKVAKELEDAQDMAVKSEAKVAETLKALRAAQAVAYDQLDKAASDAHTEAVNAATTDYKAAVALSKKAKNKVASLMGESQKATENKAKLTKAKEGKPAVTPTAVRKAAQADRDASPAVEGAAPGTAPILTAAEIRQAMKDIAKGTENAIILKVVGTLNDVFSGKLTPKMALEDLEKVLKVKAPTAKK